MAAAGAADGLQLVLPEVAAEQQRTKTAAAAAQQRAMGDGRDGSEQPAAYANPRPSSEEWASMTTGQQKK